MSSLGSWLGNWDPAVWVAVISVMGLVFQNWLQGRSGARREALIRTDQAELRARDDRERAADREAHAREMEAAYRREIDERWRSARYEIHAKVLAKADSAWNQLEFVLRSDLVARMDLGDRAQFMPHGELDSLRLEGEQVQVLASIDAAENCERLLAFLMSIEGRIDTEHTDDLVLDLVEEQYLAHRLAYRQSVRRELGTS